MSRFNLPILFAVCTSNHAAAAAAATALCFHHHFLVPAYGGAPPPVIGVVVWLVELRMLSASVDAEGDCLRWLGALMFCGTLVLNFKTAIFS